MKNCPNCNTSLNDDAVFCYNCGTQFAGGAAQAQPQPNQQPQQPQPNQQYQQYQQYQQAQPQKPAFNPYDHTAEFDAKDISENKVFAMVCYLLGIPGVIIALLASHASKYAMFHVRQSLKFTVVNMLLGFCMAILFWTIIIPVAGGICMGILAVLRIICFFQICGGKAKEPAILRSLPFLK